MEHYSMLTEYDIEVAKTEALLEVAKACRNYENSCLGIVNESAYSEYDDYAVTTEGLIGDFFRAIGEAIVNFFRTIIDFFKNLFGRGGGGGGSSSPSSDTNRSTEQAANHVKDNIKNISTHSPDEIQRAVDKLVSEIRPIDGEKAYQYYERAQAAIARAYHEGIIPEHIVKRLESDVSSTYDSLVRRSQRKLERDRAADDFEDLVSPSDAKKIGDTIASTVDTLVTPEKIEKHVSECRAIRGRGERIYNRLKGNTYRVDIDDPRTFVKVPVADLCRTIVTLIGAMDESIREFNFNEKSMNDRIEDLKRVIDMGSRSKDDEYLKALQKQQRMLSGRLKLFEESPHVTGEFLRESIGKTLPKYFDMSDKSSDIKSVLSEALYGSDKNYAFIEFKVLDSDIEDYFDVYVKGTIVRQCDDAVSMLKKKEAMLKDVVADAKKAVDTLSAKYKDDTEASPIINSIRSTITSMSNLNINTFSRYAACVSIVKKAIERRYLMSWEASSEIRNTAELIDAKLLKRMEMGDKHKFPKQTPSVTRKVAESCTLESALTTVDQFF